MTEDRDPIQGRKRVTFEQAEGAASLPTQLQLKEVSQELRAVLWRLVYDSLEKHMEYSHMSGTCNLRDPWRRILRNLHIYRDHGMADEFVEDANRQADFIKDIFQKGDYLQIFGWLQEVLRSNPPYLFAENVDRELRYCRAPYRVIDKKTIIPVGSDLELDTLKQALADLATSEFQGARAHLRNATKLLSAGKWADSTRESIHSVESVARVIDGSGEFSKALARLEKSVKIHGAMKDGFKKLYGYSSDENGIRHPMLESDSKV